MIDPRRQLSRTTRLLIAAILILLLAGGLYLALRDTSPISDSPAAPDGSSSSSSMQPGQTTPPQTPPNPSEATESFSGKIVCLPKGGDGPQTMECAIGLQLADGRYYALRNNPKYDLPTGTAVKVSGVVTAPGDGEKYLIDGTIDVRTIEKAE